MDRVMDTNGKVVSDQISGYSVVFTFAKFPLEKVEYISSPLKI